MEVEARGGKSRLVEKRYCNLSMTRGRVWMRGKDKR